MLKITFKDVGQGDSIILEWNDDFGKPKVGIIDSNLYNNKNPVLDFLKIEDYTEIEFIVLSHPHSDHFSGLPEILEFCEDKKVKIHNFIHTCITHKSFIKSCTISTSHQIQLINIFKFIEDYKKKNPIRVGTVEAGVFENIFILNSKYQIQFLSPFHEDYVKLIKGRVAKAGEEKEGNNPNINGLSTQMKITNQDNNEFILLTADSPKSTFLRTYRKFPEIFKSKMNLGQSAHHGAKGNHQKSFWNSINKNDNCPVVFSVGDNTYGHPNQDVIDYFLQKKFKPYFTNIPQSQTKISSKNSSILDLVSGISKTQSKGCISMGDQVFTPFI